jgi:hypothetical protein
MPGGENCADRARVVLAIWRRERQLWLSPGRRGGRDPCGNVFASERQARHGPENSDKIFDASQVWI